MDKVRRVTNKEVVVQSKKTTCTTITKSIQVKVKNFWITLKRYDIEIWKDKT